MMTDSGATTSAPLSPVPLRCNLIIIYCIYSSSWQFFIECCLYVLYFRFTKEVERWFKVLLPILHKQLRKNGGPILMIQPENEYGSYYACDHTYTKWLSDLVRWYFGPDVVQFTSKFKNWLIVGFIKTKIHATEMRKTVQMDGMQQRKKEISLKILLHEQDSTICVSSQTCIYRKTLTGREQWHSLATAQNQLKYALASRISPLYA